MSDKRIGIFRARDLVSEETGDVLFFDRDLGAMLKHIHSQAADLSVAEHKGFATPVNGLRGNRIGEIAVLPVNGDSAVYEIKTVSGDDDGETAKQTPPGKAGDWDVQTLIFLKDSFTLETAKAWIASHKEFSDHGVDETTTSYRFRQYDPEHFSKFRTIVIADGIKGVYGQVADTKRDESDGAQGEVEASIDEHEVIQALNADIVKRGVRLLLGSESISKADGEAEEHFILGLVLEPNDGEDGAPLKPDTQGDVYSKKAVRDTAHGWMERYGAVDLMHSWEALGAASIAVLESYIAPVDFSIGEGDGQYQVVKGTWLLALRVLDENLWTAIKAGHIGAFSVGGKATRSPLTDTDSGEE